MGSSVEARASSSTREAAIELTAEPEHVGGGDELADPALARGRQLGGPGHRLARNRVGAPMAGRRGGALECRRGLLVRPGGGRRQVPGAPVEVAVAAERVRPASGAPAARRSGSAVWYTADRNSGVGELEPAVVHVEHAGLDRRGQGALVDADRLRGPLHDPGLGLPVGRGDDQQPPHLVREALDAAKERPLEAGAGGQRRVERRAPGRAGRR